METNYHLKREAQQLLDAYGLLAHKGTVHGSFFLDLMVCPDIDVYIPSEHCSDIFALARTLYNNNITNEIYVMKGTTAGVPEAKHIQVRTNVKAERARWKIDI